MLGFLAVLWSEPIVLGGTSKPIVMSLKTNSGGKDVSNVVKEDLDASLRFSCFFEDLPEAQYKVHITAQSSNEFGVSVFNTDNKKIFDATVRPKERNTRRLAHIISDVIFERIQGVKGHFNTKLAYVVGCGYTSQRVRTSEHTYTLRGVAKTKLMLADYDGKNAVEIYSSNSCILGPEFSPCGTRISFRTLNNEGNQTPYILDVSSGRVTSLAKMSQSAFGSNIFGRSISSLKFGNTKDEIVFARSQKGTTYILSYNIASGSKNIVTTKRNQYIQTCPSYSVDGRVLAYSADTSGAETIYVQDAGAFVSMPLPKKMRFSQPKWCHFSKNKQRLYFSGRGLGSSSIWYVDYFGSNQNIQDKDIRQVVSTQKPSFIERPCPSKNGLYVVYVHQYGNQSEIIMMDDRGRHIPLYDHLANKNVLSAAWSG